MYTIDQLTTQLEKANIELARLIANGETGNILIIINSYITDLKKDISKLNN